MNISLCNSVFSFDSLFQCFLPKQTEQPLETRFSLAIDKRLDSYPFNLKLDNARISHISTSLKYMTNPTQSHDIPPIFLKKNVKGMTLDMVIHEDVVGFYKNIVKSMISEKKVISLHIVLNSVHILLSAYPIHDNKNKIIGCTILEVPYVDVESFS